MRRPLPFAMLVVLGVVIDQLAKYLAFWLIPEGGSVPLLDGIFHLTHARNHGVAFSMLSGRPLLILCIVGLAVPALVWWYAVSWRTGPAVLLAGQGLLLAGALGNLIDRAQFGYVRDFFDFVPPLPLIGKWAIFNVADICICVGVGCFLLAEFRRPAASSSQDASTKAEPNRPV